MMLELLIAIIILAVALLALLPAVSGSLRARAQAEALTLAVEQARSRLEVVGSTEPLHEGQSRVTLANGWRQQVSIRRLPSSVGESSLIAFAVEAAIFDSKGDLLTSLSTVRLGEAP